MTPHSICALLACAAGFVGLLLPWQLRDPQFGFGHSQGGAVGILLFAVVTHVFGTSGLRSAPWWRPVITIVLGFGGMIAFASYAYDAGAYWPRWSGPWTTFVALVVLILVAAHELRRALTRSGTASGS